MICGLHSFIPKTQWVENWWALSHSPYHPYTLSGFQRSNTPCPHYKVGRDQLLQGRGKEQELVGKKGEEGTPFLLSSWILPRVHTRVKALRTDWEGGRCGRNCLCCKGAQGLHFEPGQGGGATNNWCCREAGISLSTANSACAVRLTPLDNNYTPILPEEQKRPLKSTCGDNQL